MCCSRQWECELLLQLRQQQRPAAASRFSSKQSGPALSPQKCPRGVKSGLRKNSSSGGSNRWQLKRGAVKCNVPRCGGRAAFRRRSRAIRDLPKIGRSRKTQLPRDVSPQARSMTLSSLFRAARPPLSYSPYLYFHVSRPTPRRDETHHGRTVRKIYKGAVPAMLFTPLSKLCRQPL